MHHGGGGINPIFIAILLFVIVPAIVRATKKQSAPRTREYVAQTTQQRPAGGGFAALAQFEIATPPRADTGGDPELAELAELEALKRAEQRRAPVPAPRAQAFEAELLREHLTPSQTKAEMQRALNAAAVARAQASRTQASRTQGSAAKSSPKAQKKTSTSFGYRDALEPLPLLSAHKPLKPLKAWNAAVPLPPRPTL